MNREELEKEILNKGLTAPRITQAYIDSLIVSESTHRFPGTTLVVCCLVLKNGQTVIGKSACVMPENFDLSIGEQVSRKKAVDAIWELEGYLLAQRIQDAKDQAVDVLAPHAMLSPTSEGFYAAYQGSSVFMTRVSCEQIDPATPKFLAYQDPITRKLLPVRGSSVKCWAKVKGEVQ